MISEFSTELKYIRNVSETTLSLYGWAFKAFDGALESRATVIERVKKLRDGGLSAVSVNTYLRCINAYFNWLHKEHRRDLIRITKLKEEEKVLVVLTEAHITALIKDKSALHVLICLLLDCGLRIDEALSLAPKDIDLESLQLKVLGKGNKQRIVPFSTEMRKYLYRHITNKGGSKHFAFGTRTDKKPSQRNVLREFKKVGQRIGCPGLHPHSLRHTFSVTYLRRGGNIEYLRRILGHSSLLTTQRYVRSLGVDDLTAVHSELSCLSRR